MTQLRAVIVEDEPSGRERLQDLLALEKVHLVAACEDVSAARDVLQRELVDVLFLDVQMPGGDGFELLRGRRPEERPAIVFVTAHDSYAARAFDEEAVDFLLKPYDRERFREALRRARERVASRGGVDLTRRFESLLDQIRPTEARWVVRTAGRISFLKTADIEWLDAAGNSVRIHAQGKVHRLRASMQSLEERLDPKRFARIHRSTIVNMDRVEEVLLNPHGDYVVVTDRGHRLTVGRNYRDRLQALLPSSGNS